MSNEKTTIQLVSTETLLVLIFLTLKLTGYITWSWWWVFAPYWIGTGIILLVCLIILIVAGIIAIFDK